MALLWMRATLSVKRLRIHWRIDHKQRDVFRLQTLQNSSCSFEYWSTESLVSEVTLSIGCWCHLAPMQGLVAIDIVVLCGCDFLQ